jgi:AcrR family transcriptional regulator
MPEERTLTEKQAARRRRVLVAAIDLAAEGGYDGVQMRAVADRAGVAVATVYHYFHSKDHLLAESLDEWLGELAASVTRRPAAGETTLERVLDLLRRTTNAMRANPAVTAAVIRGLVAEGDAVAACQQHLHESFSAMLATAFPADYPTARRDAVIRSLEHIWFSELVGWKNGWHPIDQGVEELETAATLFLGES